MCIRDRDGAVIGQSSEGSVNVAGAGKIIGQTVKRVLKPSKIDKYSDDHDGSREAADKARARALELETSKASRDFLKKQQEGIKATAKPKAAPKRSSNNSSSDIKESIHHDKDFDRWLDKGRFEPGGCRGC